MCRQLSEMLGLALWAMTFLAMLLQWDLYQCPRAFALASACLRENAVVRAIVILTWATVLHSRRRRRNGTRLRWSIRAKCTALVWTKKNMPLFFFLQNVSKAGRKHENQVFWVKRFGRNSFVRTYSALF